VTGFLPLITTTCLEVVIMADNDGSFGLKCFTCHLSPNCKSIKPLAFGEKWPGNIDWTFVFVIACGIKLLDVLVIAIITLKFMFCRSDAILKCMLKIFSWLLVFPWVVATPVFGVVYFKLLPAVGKDLPTLLGPMFSEQVGLIFLIMFIIGCVFWLITLASLPFMYKQLQEPSTMVEEFVENEEYVVAR